MSVLEAVIAGLGAIGSILLGLVAYIFGVTIKRIEAVEAKLEDKLDKKEFTELMNMKLASVTDDIKEIKDILYLLMEMRLKKNNRKQSKR